MLRCRSAESTRFFFCLNIVVAYTHTQIEVYRKRNDSRHTTDLHAMSWMLTASLSCCRSCFACALLCSGANDSGEEQLLKFSGKLAHSKVSSENSFFLDFNLFYMRAQLIANLIRQILL